MNSGAMTSGPGGGGIRMAEPPRFETHDLGACREYIRGFTGTHTFAANNVSSLEYFTHHERQIGHISLNYTDLSCTGGFQIAKAVGAGCYAFQFLLEGSCELTSAAGCQWVRPGDVFILGPDEATREHWPSLCRQFVVRVDRAFVDQLVANEIHHELKRPLVFKQVGRDPGIVSWLHHIVNSPSDTAPHNSAVTSVMADRRVARSIERALGMMLIAGFEHSESPDFHRPNTTIAPYYVKRAEEYVRTHAHDDMTVEDIAHAAGVSVRTMFYGFKHWRNTTPMAHVRELRLSAARKALQGAGSTGMSVSEAAVNAGFTNFSQFSKIYKMRFGETPSATRRGN